LNYWGYIISGFLCGYGAQLAKGSVITHGVCGVANLSIRSIVALLLNTIFGIGLVTLRHNVPFLVAASDESFSYDSDLNDKRMVVSYILVLAALAYFIYINVQAWAHKE